MRINDLGEGLLALADEDRVEEGRNRLRVEGAGPAADNERVVLTPVDRAKRDTGEVERLEHVAVAQFVGQRDADEVEIAYRRA